MRCPGVREPQPLFENFGDFGEFDALIEEALDAFEQSFAGPTIEFDSGVADQGYSLELTAGGDTTSAQCVGYLPEVRQLIIDYEPVPGVDEIRVFAESDTDTTLWVSINDADHRCDDDSYGNSDPIVVFRDAASGQYSIWVGTYSEDQNATATLYISEKMPGD